MKIRNNTNQELVFYFGDSHREIPEAEIILAVGGEIDLTECPVEDISIQENKFKTGEEFK